MDKNKLMVAEEFGTDITTKIIVKILNFFERFKKKKQEDQE